MNDNLSTVHFKAVSNEIEGRFFSLKEACELRRVIDARTIEDPRLRAAAAKCWEPSPQSAGEPNNEATE